MLYGQNLCNKQITISYVYRFHCERVKICFVPLTYLLNIFVTLFLMFSKFSPLKHCTIFICILVIRILVHKR